MKLSQQILAHKKAFPDTKAAELAKMFKTKVNYVYTVLYLDRKKQKATKVKAVKLAARKAPPMIPMGEQAAANTSFDAFMAKERAALVTQQVADLKKEIDELTVIIAYLEHRCNKAESKVGLAV